MISFVPFPYQQAPDLRSKHIKWTPAANRTQCLKSQEIIFKNFIRNLTELSKNLVRDWRFTKRYLYFKTWNFTPHQYTKKDEQLSRLSRSRKKGSRTISLLMATNPSRNLLWSLLEEISIALNWIKIFPHFISVELSLSLLISFTAMVDTLFAAHNYLLLCHPPPFRNISINGRLIRLPIMEFLA